MKGRASMIVAITLQNLFEWKSNWNKGDGRQMLPL